MTEIAALLGRTEEAGDHIGEVREVALCGAIDAALGLSGVTLAGDYLVVGADEGHKIEILERGDEHGWRLVRKLALAKDDQEADIEAIAFGDGYLYVVGSHSHRRRRIKQDLTVRRNRERLLQVQAQASRNRLYRFTFDPATGETGRPEVLDLSKRLRKDPLLKPFFGLPSKENGIDIEGMAIRDGVLYLGFRGPVLRDNFVPVMAMRYDDPKTYQLLLVRLDGHGIRDIVATEDGFLIVSGPMNDAPGPFRLWWWDGRDQVPGKDREVVPAVPIGPVSASGGARAEGLALLGCDSERADILVVFETNTAAQAVRMSIRLPKGCAPA